MGRTWQYMLLVEKIQVDVTKDTALQHLMEEKRWTSQNTAARNNFPVPDHCDESSAFKCGDKLHNEERETTIVCSGSSSDSDDPVLYGDCDQNRSEEDAKFTLRYPSVKLMSPESTAPSMAMTAIASTNPLGFHFNPTEAPTGTAWSLPNIKTETCTKGESAEDEDQPLDLSAKSTITTENSPPEQMRHFVAFNSVMVQGAASKIPVLNANRHIFKAKPRLSPSTGRRTYTEDELQAALRDIQSGKLGTRRAAVIYGIPRSTLRNKVYKLAMEKERDSAGTIFQSLAEDTKGTDGNDKEEDLEDRDEEEDDADKDSGPEDEKDAEKALESQPLHKPLLTVEDFIRFSQQNAGDASLKALLQQQQNASKIMSDFKGDERTPPGPPPPLFSMFPPGAAEIWGNLDPITIAPYISTLMAATRDNFNITSLLSRAANPYAATATSPEESPANSPTAFGPKFPAPLFPELVQRMMQERFMIEEQRKREYESFRSERQQIEGTRHGQSDNSRNSHTTPNPVYKNGSDNFTSTSGNYGGPSNKTTSEGSDKSPSPSPRGGRSESSSPSPSDRSVNLRDVIAKTISQRFQQPQPTPPGDMTRQMYHTNLIMNEGFRHNYPTAIGTSVIRNHIPPLPPSEDRKVLGSSKVPLPSSSGNSGCAGGAAGKGTRPKRGKYRNYDRDSLVEAVRAVQRGEMSVHRAGSYYGVPHSTLEYKVKERHLMRPRKREPKNPPPQSTTSDDGGKRREDGSVLRLSAGEKPSHVTPGVAISPKLGSKSTFSGQNTPNGLKMTPFENATFPGAASFPFWPPNPFQLAAMEYPRSASGFAPNPEHLLASHFVQRMQEGQQPTTPAMAALGKSAREVAERLYDGSPNGSFLDGIIRSSLETNVHGTGNPEQQQFARNNLLEQLYRNKYLSSQSSEVHGREDDRKPYGGVNFFTISPEKMETEGEGEGVTPSSVHSDDEARLRDNNGRDKEDDDVGDMTPLPLECVIKQEPDN